MPLLLAASLLLLQRLLGITPTSLSRWSSSCARCTLVLRASRIRAVCSVATAFPPSSAVLACSMPSGRGTKTGWSGQREDTGKAAKGRKKKKRGQRERKRPAWPTWPIAPQPPLSDGARPLHTACHQDPTDIGTAPCKRSPRDVLCFVLRQHSDASTLQQTSIHHWLGCLLLSVRMPRRRFP